MADGLVHLVAIKRFGRHLPVLVSRVAELDGEARQGLKFLVLFPITQMVTRGFVSL